MNPPAFEHWETRALLSVETDEMCAPRASNLRRWMLHHLLQPDPLGKLRGSDCSGSTGTARSPGGTQYCIIFTTPASMLREILGPRPVKDLRGRHRSRLLETTSTLGEALGDERYSSQCAARRGTWPLYSSANWQPSGNRWPFKGGSSHQRVHFGGTKIFLEHFFFSRAEARSEFVPSSFSCHAAPTKLPPSSARHVTLVACPLVSLRSRMLLSPTSSLGRALGYCTLTC